jgi:HlyD family secretion protein
VDSQFRRIRLAKRVALAAAFVAAFVVVLSWIPRWIKPSVSRDSIRTAVVDAGPVEATISASGTVVPEFEKVLSSPLDARVVKILKTPGSIVAKGEPILDLDVSESVLSLDKLSEQLLLKENEQIQQKLELESTLNNLRSQLRLKEVEVKSLQIQVDKQQSLNKAGLNSDEQLREAQVNEEKARIELQQLEESIRHAERATQAKLDGLLLEMGTLQKEKKQSQRQLDLATTKADRNGVLTWVVEEEGSLVRTGDVLARIADLSSFRVEATVSDIHATRLSSGVPVLVRLNDDAQLEGSITSVLPTIEDGIVTVIASLSDKSNEMLRSNLRVDVFIVTGRKQRALRIKRGSFANREGAQDVFVIRGDKAIRTPARLGLFSFDYCEVKDGLLEGDEVVISSMESYEHLKEVRLN